MLNTKKQRCVVCSRWFKPSPFAFRQKVCSRVRCRAAAQKERLRKWRENNPDYFLGEYRKKTSQKKWKKQKLNWQKTHTGYFRVWRERNRGKYNIYMREYMSRWRELKRG